MGQQASNLPIVKKYHTSRITNIASERANHYDETARMWKKRFRNMKIFRIAS